MNKYINKIRKAISNASKVDTMLYNVESSIPSSINASIETNVEKHIERQIAIASLKTNMLISKDIGITKEQHFGQEVIVSLTSHGKRIYDVYLTIESLLEQTVRPNKIILWLSEDKFKNAKLPQSLTRLVNRGLSIEFCKDIGSYTKLIPTLKKYPNDIIISVDDDILYPYDLIENLLCSHKEYPTLVLFARGHRIKMNVAGQIANYNDWYYDIQDEICDNLNFPTGVGGILYPPRCFHDDILREDLFLKLAPSADDVWFKAMVMAKGTLSKKVYMPNNYIDIKKEAQTNTALSRINVLQNKNDEQIKSVFSYYNLFK